MINIRTNIFETNSSSSHSMVLCDDKTWKDFCDRKLYYNVLSRYHERYLEKYPLDKYKWVPEDSFLNDLPIFCTFKEMKDWLGTRSHDIINDNIRERYFNKENRNNLHHLSCGLLFSVETFYTIDELEGFEYNEETHKLNLYYYFG